MGETQVMLCAPMLTSHTLWTSNRILRNHCVSRHHPVPGCLQLSWVACEDNCLCSEETDKDVRLLANRLLSGVGICRHLEKVFLRRIRHLIHAHQLRLPIYEIPASFGVLKQ